MLGIVFEEKSLSEKLSMKLQFFWDDFLIHIFLIISIDTFDRDHLLTDTLAFDIRFQFFVLRRFPFLQNLFFAHHKTRVHTHHQAFLQTAVATFTFLVVENFAVFLASAVVRFLVAN